MEAYRFQDNHLFQSMPCQPTQQDNEGTPGDKKGKEQPSRFADASESSKRPAMAGRPQHPIYFGNISPKKKFITTLMDNHKSNSKCGKCG